MNIIRYLINQPNLKVLIIIPDFPQLLNFFPDFHLQFLILLVQFPVILILHIRKKILLELRPAINNFHKLITFRVLDLHLVHPPELLVFHFIFSLLRIVLNNSLKLFSLLQFQVFFLEKLFLLILSKPHQLPHFLSNSVLDLSREFFFLVHP